ncbi:unnamed protein product [Pylaiella littoralis]
MTPIHAGLSVETPHGVGVVVCVRNDGMVVAKLGGKVGGPGFIGYFHPSSVSPAPFSSPLYLATTTTTTTTSSTSSRPFSSAPFRAPGAVVAGAVDGGFGVRSGSAPSFQPSAATVPLPGMFQPVSPTGMDCCDGDGGGGGGGNSMTTAAQQPPLNMPPIRDQQQQQQEQQHRGFQLQKQEMFLRGPDRPCMTPPPSKRRRSAEGNSSVHH